MASLNVTVDPRDATALKQHHEDIVALLRLRPRTARELGAVFFSYRARISELRQAGYVIRANRLSGRNFEYQLVSEPKDTHVAEGNGADAAHKVGAGELLPAGDEGGTVGLGGDSTDGGTGQDPRNAVAGGRADLGNEDDRAAADDRRVAPLIAYEQFLATKFRAVAPTGFDAVVDAPYLFPFQRDLVRWAVRRGRAAIFSDTGTGKTRQELEWARLVVARAGGRVLMLAPLAVAPQTVREGASIGIPVTLCREASDVRDGINITNYDRLHKFNAADFAGVVLDESGCIKHWETKTLAHLLDAFGQTPFKLCASATPAPNDFAELGTHSEFLNVRSRVEMLAEFFVHDGSSSANTGGWRLKGHGRKAFWEWVASWAALLRKPSDLGYEDTGYDLPPLEVHHHVLAADQAETFATGVLFPEMAHGLTAQRTAKRASLGRRVAACAELVRSDAEQWVVWCELNAEQDALADDLDGQCVSIYGALDADEKEARYELWRTGAARVLLSKASIFGFGINMQQCARTAFVGPSNSYESYYQAVRRFYRFGQARPVHVHVFLSEAERSILENLKRKESDAARMAEELSAATRDAVRANISGHRRRHNEYRAPSPAWPAWLQGE